MSREQLLTWSAADHLLQEARVVVVVGYSFGMADEHFNDLLRRTKDTTRILVVNPNADTAGRAAARILNIDYKMLTERNRDDIRCRSSRRLTCLNVTGERLDSGLVDGALR